MLIGKLQGSEVFLRQQDVGGQGEAGPGHGIFMPVAGVASVGIVTLVGEGGF